MSSRLSTCIPTFLPTKSPALKRGFEGRDAMQRGLPWKIVAKPMHATLRAMAGMSTFCSTDPMATCTALLRHRNEGKKGIRAHYALAENSFHTRLQDTRPRSPINHRLPINVTKCKVHKSMVFGGG